MQFGPSNRKKHDKTTEQIRAPCSKHFNQQKKEETGETEHRKQELNAALKAFSSKSFYMS